MKWDKEGSMSRVVDHQFTLKNKGKIIQQSELTQKSQNPDELIYHYNKASYKSATISKTKPNYPTSWQSTNNVETTLNSKPNEMHDIYIYKTLATAFFLSFTIFKKSTHFFQSK